MISPFVSILKYKSFHKNSYFIWFSQFTEINADWSGYHLFDFKSTLGYRPGGEGGKVKKIFELGYIEGFNVLKEVLCLQRIGSRLTDRLWVYVTLINSLYVQVLLTMGIVFMLLVYPNELLNLSYTLSW